MPDKCGHKKKACETCGICPRCPSDNPDCVEVHLKRKVGQHGPRKRKLQDEDLGDLSDKPLRSKRQSITRKDPMMSTVELSDLYEDYNPDDDVEDVRYDAKSFRELLKLLHIEDARKTPYSADERSYYRALKLSKELISAMCKLVYPEDFGRLEKAFLDKEKVVEQKKDDSDKVVPVKKAAVESMIVISCTHPMGEVRQVTLACLSSLFTIEALRKLRKDMPKDEFPQSMSDTTVSDSKDMTFGDKTIRNYRKLFIALENKLHPPGHFSRKRTSDSKLLNVVEFILANDSIGQIQPYNLATRRLEDGTTLTLPSLLRKTTVKDAWKAYCEKYPTKESRVVGFSVFSAVCMMMAPQTTQAKAGLDTYYITYVVENFEMIRKQLPMWIADKDKVDELMKTLNWAEVFLKCKYRQHISVALNHESDIPVCHCAGFALNPQAQDFPTTGLQLQPFPVDVCEGHSTGCKECETLMKLPDIIMECINQEDDNTVKHVKGFAQKVLTYCGHEVRDAWQSARVKELFESADSDTIFVLQDYKMKILERRYR